VQSKQPEVSVWSTRLKTAREARGLSQRVLGIAAGIDESVASTRINRYELGVHSPSYSIASKLAAALDVPVAYLYCDDDTLARVILAFSQADATTKREILKLLAVTRAR
jgi:transcriptional regulator with XRE-family HTH domain